MLPNISIKVDVKPRAFLDRLEQIAGRFDNVRIKRTFNIAGYEGWESLNLESCVSGYHKKLCGAVISNPESDTRVFIEMVAEHWDPDPPTYDTYVGAARLLFVPLVKAYNRKYHSRCQLNIQTKTVKERELPAETKKRLTSFIVCANKSALHSNDWSRFYQFIAFCHAHHVKLSEGGLKHLLVKAGFSSEKAEYLADIYYHGRNLLASKC